MSVFNSIFYKLISWAILSTVLVGFAASAHEVNPTIADLSVAEGTATLDLRLNAEAFLSGLDLDAVGDTDDAAEAADYDTLQAQPGSEIAKAFTENVDRFLSGVTLTADGAPLALTLVEIQTPEQSVENVARPSLARFTAALPADGQRLQLAWPEGYGGLVLRQQGVSAPYTGILQGGETSDVMNFLTGSPQSGFAVFLDYIPVGFDHILPKGLDHILFVLGLFFLSLRLGPLFWQVSAFTLAHTVTLAAGALGWVTVPGSIVEPIIAASIVYVGVENILSRGLSPWRPVVVFLFGLLHGLGFASVLGDFGLPSGQFIPALLGFNIGVEIGQLTVIAIAFLGVGLWFGRKPWYRRRIANPASAAIAVVGAYWFIERVFL
ncbi:HupE/UreJ family protein [Cognatishimia sp. SS12]|uniref:HupE/UreJ family protein n=1 Tax=Cognatishimia sp. SS12 TaxID=2979465 RepID=UPI0023301B9D|nr:HupE/UreJ family protein [Cognatishimia sp. SS12]MDC0737159.1 HupE/UreJ family protein [Cognatishimia sp. SS12]